MVCGGAISGLFAYMVHLIQVCGWCKCVRLLSEGAMFWLWRWFVRFGYMAHPLQMHVNTAIIEGLEDYYGRYADTSYHLGWKHNKSYTQR